MSELADLELVAASAKDDSRAFGRLVERHHAAVTTVAFAATRDLAISEDIAHDTFIVCSPARVAQARRVAPRLAFALR